MLFLYRHARSKFVDLEDYHRNRVQVIAGRHHIKKWRPLWLIPPDALRQTTSDLLFLGICLPHYEVGRENPTS